MIIGQRIQTKLISFLLDHRDEIVKLAIFFCNFYYKFEINITSLLEKI